MTARQLPLPFPAPAAHADPDFIAAPSNQAALAWLARPADWPLGRLVLHGPAGCGKTHLVLLWCARVGGALLAAPALHSVPVLPEGAPIALDDADLAEETALFHLINATAEAGRPLLLAAREAPSRWPTRLPDLASRLRASLAVGIGRAEDALLAPLLTRLLAERQLDVSPALQSWLLTRLPREAAAVAEAVARLDRAALERGRGITRALAAGIVAGMADPNQDDPDENERDEDEGAKLNGRMKF